MKPLQLSTSCKMQAARFLTRSYIVRLAGQRPQAREMDAKLDRVMARQSDDMREVKAMIAQLVELQRARP